VQRASNEPIRRFPADLRDDARVSIVINTLNEAENLSACVDSVRWADQIIVVDMMSDDNTQVLASELGCEVYSHQRTGYVEPARAFAVSKARNDWVLILDADERCSPALADWIVHNLPRAGFSGVMIPRRNFVKGRWMRCCGWYPDKQLRLLNRRGAFFPTEIHHAPRLTGEIFEISGNSDICIDHLAVFSMQDRISKQLRYSAISADALCRKGKKCSALSVFGRVIWSFLAAYFLRGGLANGSRGLVFSLERANSTFMKYSILWDLNQVEPRDAGSIFP
jgi:glycosyltransferase involved in cell wall biosynthesis